MRKILSILAVLFVSVTCFSQSIVPRANSSYTVQDSRFKAALNLFVPSYADTASANAGTAEGIDSLGAVIYVYSTQSLWVRSYVTGKTWVEIGSGGGGGSGTVTNIATGLGLSGGPITTTGTLLVDTASASILSRQRAANTYQLLSSDVASQGLLKSGDTTVFAGPFGTPGIFTNDRTLNTNRNIMNWTNGVAAVTGGVNWQFSKQAYSPFQFISADTLVSNDAALSNARPLSGLFARRTMYFNSGVYRQNEMYGHYIGATYNFQDSMVFRTDGGDYNQAVINELRIKPRGTGPQVARTGHAAGGNLSLNQGVAASVSNFYMDGDGVNRLKLNGAGVGHRSYLIMFSGTTDTIENFVYYGPSSFMGGGAKVLKSYVLAPSGATSGVNEVDSAFFLYDTARRERSYIAGSMLLGVGDSTVTQAQFRVNGSSVLNGWSGYLNNVAADYTTRSFTDKNYVDSAIAAGGGGTSPFLPVTGTGTATAAVIGDLDGNTLEISGGPVGIGVAPDPSYYFVVGADELFYIDDGNVKFQAINATGGGNISEVHSSAGATSATLQMQADFNAGTKTSLINFSADATDAIIFYSADTHTFTGTVNLGTAGSLTGVMTLSGVTSGTITIQPASAAGTYTLTLPTDDGTASQFLQTNGSGVLSWATAAGSGDVTKVGTPVNNQLGVWTGNGTIEGDANLTFASSTLSIGVAGSTTGILTLSGLTSGSASIQSDALGNALNGTTLSGLGVIWSTSGGYVDSDFTLADVNTAQNVFPSGYDVWTLQASTTYRFKGKYFISTGGGNVSVAMSFALAGGASVTSIRYGIISGIFNDGATSGTQLMGRQNSVSSWVVTSASATSGRYIDFEGIIRVNAGGTVTPQLTFSAAPGGTNTLDANSFIEFIPIGTNTITSIGPAS